MDKIWIAVCEGDNYSNLYSSKTKEGVYAQVAESCRENWDCSTQAGKYVPISWNDMEDVAIWYQYHDEYDTCDIQEVEVK